MRSFWIAASAALLPLTLAAGAPQGWTALFKKLPDTPASAAQAAQRFAPDAEGSDARWLDAAAAAVAPELTRRATAIANGMAGGMPGVAPGDAEAMAARMESMSQAEQMAMAMQMMQQVNRPQAPLTELSRADQELIRLYSERGEKQGAAYERAIAENRKIGTAAEGWDRQHHALVAEYQARMDQVSGCNKEAAERKLQAEHRDAHARLASRLLGEARHAITPLQRDAGEVAAFLDARRPNDRAYADPRVRTPVDSYLQHAVQVFGLYDSALRHVYRYGALWHDPAPLHTYSGAC